MLKTLARASSLGFSELEIITERVRESEGCPRTIYTPLFSGVRWDVQDYSLEDVDRIEVISGPGGTLWDANTVNGVVSIISKSAQDTQGLYLEGVGGTEIRQSYGVRYGGSVASNIHYRVYAKYSDGDSETLANRGDANDSRVKPEGRSTGAQRFQAFSRTTCPIS